MVLYDIKESRFGILYTLLVLPISPVYYDTKVMRMRPLAVLVLCSLLCTILAATCTYNGRENHVTCGDVECSTKEAGNLELPAGHYRIGVFYEHPRLHTPWFNLYRKRSSGGGYWDYSTLVPELSCRGGFGLHPGTISQGCITVTEGDCFQRLKEVIMGYGSKNFSPYECRVCRRWWFGSSYRCLFTQRIPRSYTTDLEAY